MGPRSGLTMAKASKPGAGAGTSEGYYSYNVQLVSKNKTEKVAETVSGVLIIRASCQCHRQATCAGRPGPHLLLASLFSFVPPPSPSLFSFPTTSKPVFQALRPKFSVLFVTFIQRTTMSCVSPDPANTVTDRLNQLLSSGGNGYVLSLCPSQQYMITAPILFAAPNQEISTQGYPTGDDRATLVVSGPVSNGTGHTNAVDGTCNTCSGVKLRNIQVRSYQREAALW
jgi:hypothetical protein